jgi:hypothetical protein
MRRTIVSASGRYSSVLSPKLMPIGSASKRIASTETTTSSCPTRERARSSLAALIRGSISARHSASAFAGGAAPAGVLAFRRNQPMTAASLSHHGRLRPRIHVTVASRASPIAGARVRSGGLRLRGARGLQHMGGAGSPGSATPEAGITPGGRAPRRGSASRAV